jgi:TPR repeat protein
VTTADELLSRPDNAETGRAILEWITELRGRILRGDMMIGILPVDEVKKAPVVLRKAAADCGVAEAWLELGSWLARPPFGVPDVRKALSVLREAVSSKVPGSELKLVQVLWFYGRDAASAADRSEAHELLTGLVRRNPQDGEAVHFLGHFTFQGFGVAADPAEAGRLQQQAADLGNTDAVFELFLYHQAGAGVPKDEKKALELLRRAAEAGHPRAMYNMGAFHASGRGLPRDPAAAFHWYTKASEAGNPRATAGLAVMHAQGDGVPKDLETAKLLFDEAEYMGVDVTAMREAVGLAQEPE